MESSAGNIAAIPRFRLYMKYKGLQFCPFWIWVRTICSYEGSVYVFEKYPYYLNTHTVRLVNNQNGYILIWSYYTLMTRPHEYMRMIQILIWPGTAQLYLCFIYVILTLNYYNLMDMLFVVCVQIIKVQWGFFLHLLSMLTFAK